MFHFQLQIFIIYYKVGLYLIWNLFLFFYQSLMSLYIYCPTLSNMVAVKVWAMLKCHAKTITRTKYGNS